MAGACSGATQMPIMKLTMPAAMLFQKVVSAGEIPSMRAVR